jgi:hypothetical protein
MLFVDVERGRAEGIALARELEGIAKAAEDESDATEHAEARIGDLDTEEFVERL